jgi:hypothetical protein
MKNSNKTIGNRTRDLPEMFYLLEVLSVTDVSKNMSRFISFKSLHTGIIVRARGLFSIKG